ncbi:hypothetical protein SAMN00777080_2526 [Aquiflexum balticum DSM 16537]|uniref:Uncharacterized protein n=1 Tax=Aquiflexum balticum DSM 16537 TaxID=758820 RepID=A0A1W2H4R7_9BACT|nr:hypothetical protein SAMN00777080_2526 [Aquiflexum balticum DSM 16537]
MYVRNYAGRLDIYVNSRLRTEMPDTSLLTSALGHPD